MQPFLQNGNTAADGKQEDIPLRIVVELGIVLKNDQIHQPHHIVLKAGVPAVRQQGQSGKAPAQAVLQKLLDAYAASRAAKGTYTAADPETRTSIRDGMGALAAALTVIVGGDGTPDNPGLDGITAGLRELADGLEEGLGGSNSAEGLEQLAQGLSALSAEYGAFDAGLAAYADGGGRMAEGYGGLHTGLEALGDGIVELAEGGRALREGTHDMQTNTADLPDILQAEIDRLLADYDPGDFSPVSFVSSKNTDTAYVQFAMATEPIKRPKEPDPPPETVKAPGFWDRFLALFR